MPTSTPELEFPSPTKAKTLSTPQTPRRSSAVKRPNGSLQRKLSAQKDATPKSAPTRGQAKMKKPEPTLLGDFLLGRPSPARTRRKSLEVVKAEMRVESVNKIQAPGGVKDRVKQWQKSSAAANPTHSPARPPSLVEDPTTTESDDAGEDERQRIRKRQAKVDQWRSATKKGGCQDHVGMEKKEKSPDIQPVVENEKKGNESVEAVKLTPKKRVVSDDHWMQGKQKKRTSPKNNLSKSAGLPGDFVRKNNTVPPLSQKIGDWAKTTAHTERVYDNISSKRKQQPSFETSKRRSATAKHSRRLANEDGIRVFASSPQSPDESESKDLGKSIENLASKNAEDHATSRKDGQRKQKEGLDHLSSRERTGRRFYSEDQNDHVSEELDINTPTKNPSGKRKSMTPDSMSDIPVGNSAFSVLDIPVGADAHAMRRPQAKPVRDSSFKGVPNVLKKIYTEGLKMAQDTIEPPRTGVNQPPSIESWLNGTSDPFVEHAGDSPPQEQKIAKSVRHQGLEARLRDSTSITHEWQKPKTRLALHDLGEKDRNTVHDHGEGTAAPRESNAMGRRHNVESYCPPLSPTGLRRSPATRSPSSRIKAHRIPLRERVAEAFRGESAAIKTPFSAEEDTHVTETVSRDYEKPSPQISNYESNRELPSLPYRTVNNGRTDTDAIIHNSKVKPKTRRELPRLPRKEVPKSNGHHLSTIASVDTFEAGAVFTETSSGYLTETSSHVSDTTITQSTSATGPPKSIPETGDRESKVSWAGSKKPGLKRRLTKHADLMSVLSLPGDGIQRSRSILSARSVRTTRSRLENATIDDLLQELAGDEVKYVRELKTLVDGVIPVLLASVLSKSETAVATGLMNPQTGVVTSKPIVDMGVALERLKSLHARIPLHDPHQLVAWASGAYRVYEQYLTAWRMGFKNIVVTLTPMSRNPSVERAAYENSTGSNGIMETDQVDVAFLLRRPLVRIKHLTKIIKGANLLIPSSETARLEELYETLLSDTRRRVKEEEARQEDLAANNTDASRARDPVSLAPIDNVAIDRSRQVKMKDFFSLELRHTSGQRVVCRVELLLRDKPKDPTDPGDLLICEIDTTTRWLLLPPVESTNVSACLGQSKSDVMVMIRGNDAGNVWSELLNLTADDEDTALEWIDALGSTPTPVSSRLSFVAGAGVAGTHQHDIDVVANDVLRPTPSLASDSEIPIGERKWMAGSQSQKANSPKSTGHFRIPRRDVGIDKDHVINNLKERRSPNNSLHYMSGAVGDDRVFKSHRPSRYHGVEESAASDGPMYSSNFEQGEYLNTRTSPGSISSPQPANQQSSSPISACHTPSQQIPSMGFLHIPKRRQTSPKLPQEAEEPFSATAEMQKPSTQRAPPLAPAAADKEDIPPPPPAHKTSTSLSTEKTPILQSLTSKFRNRRSSSPLKREYQPSVGSDTSDLETSNSESDSYTESSDEDELEASELPDVVQDPLMYSKPSPPSSTYSLPNASLAPSNSASQEPYRKAPVIPDAPRVRLIAAVSAWSDKGLWENLHPEDCSIVVGPGLIEAFVLGSTYKTHHEVSEDAEAERPLAALDLTPLVPLRQSTVVDIEIRSPPLPLSLSKWSGSIRFRTHTVEDCNKLYAAIHRARMDNPLFKRLEQERLLNSYGGQTYNAVVGTKNRMSFFSRKKSYRATARAPSSSTSDSPSNNSYASAFMNRITSGGSFNIAKSMVHTSQVAPHGNSPAISMYGSSDATSASTPPRSPNCGSLVETSMSRVVSRGTQNIKIRCYKLVTMSSWGLDIAARLTIEDPPKGMKQASTLYSGIEKRVIVTAKVPKNKKGNGSDGDRSNPVSRRASFNARRISFGGVMGLGDNKNEVEADQQYYTVLDTVIGGQCVLRYGRTGVAINVWEDLVGPNGEIGMAAAVGGVSGRTRKWMFHFSSQEEMRWVYTVLGGR